MVVAGDSNVNVAQWRVCVAERYNGDVDVGRLRHSLHREKSKTIENQSKLTPH